MTHPDSKHTNNTMLTQTEFDILDNLDMLNAPPLVSSQEQKHSMNEEDSLGAIHGTRIQWSSDIKDNTIVHLFRISVTTETKMYEIDTC